MHVFAFTTRYLKCFDIGTNPIIYLKLETNLTKNNELTNILFEKYIYILYLI